MSAAKEGTQLRRQVSARSEAAVVKLEALEAELSGYEESFKNMVIKASAGPEIAEVRKIKDELALLNGKVDALQMRGIDAVQVGELSSGQQEAREKRKGLTKRVTLLSERIVKLHEAIMEHLKEVAQTAP
ncbi:Hypothetical Protein FCC1311_097872 [Hondaea fermentalgiana]|uniref:Uncharacterized protein n=1 Tax=Hondaea fermentalgiana TaxID=2315210 RepID=A0A2R5GZT6_9STRA|nr:Hypothetical Protein FCC1311_097872 [Hondaea fermentalgiana]|eukprot:GBG33564.1 Hypothetical Protein FCC1311_097872 [Hondaea fermentalgiana]